MIFKFDKKPSSTWNFQDFDQKIAYIISCHNVNPQEDFYRNDLGFRWAIYVVCLEDNIIADTDIDLPFHCGETYRQKVNETDIKIGADYSHLGDEHFYSYDPSEGIPMEIKNDLIELSLFINKELRK